MGSSALYIHEKRRLCADFLRYPKKVKNQKGYVWQEKKECASKRGKEKELHR